jgi:autotransporter-associated beta strand protein
MVGTISGQLTGGTNISKSGAGTLVLSNNTNDYGGSTTVNAGTLQVGAAGSIPDTSALVVNSGGFFNINGFAETVGSLAGAGVITNTGAAQTLTTGGDGTNTTFSGVITNQASALNLVKTGLGTQVLSGANTYTGTTAINGGTLNVGSVESLGVSGPLGAPTTPANSITFGGGTLQYSAANQFDYSSRFSTAANQAVSIDTNGQNVTFATNLSSVGGTLAKSGAGTLTLTADNGYTGSTSVSAGTLQVGNGSTGQLSGGGSVTVSGTDTTLSGSGSIAGSTLIGSGAIIAPGVGDTSASNHTLTFTAVSAPLTLVSGSQIQLGITNETFNSVGVADALATASYTDALTYIGANGAEFTSSWNVAPAFTADMDFINLTSGTISLGTRSGGAGTGTISVANLGYVASAAKGDVFNLIDWQGVMGGTFDAGSGFSSGGIFGDFDLPTLGLGLVWDTSAVTTHGIVVVVPEPSRALLLLLGLFGLMLRRRRIA